MKQSKPAASGRKRALLCTSPAAVFSLLTLWIAWRFLDMRYALNDDAAVLRAMMGCEGGVIPDYLPHQHDLLTLPLRLLGQWRPEVPWFSWLQLLLLFAGLTQIQRCLWITLSKKRGGIAAAVCLSLAVCGGMLYVCARVTFTTTAAVLMGAAVCGLMRLADEKLTAGQTLRGVLAALCFAALAYALRLDVLPVVLCFCGLAALYALWRRLSAKAGVKGLVIGLCCAAAVLGAMAGEQAWHRNVPELREYAEWQDVRVAVLDYHSLDDLPQEVLDSIGWDESIVRLAQEFCFLPPEINTDTLHTVLDYYNSLPQPGFGEQLLSGAKGAWLLLSNRADPDRGVSGVPLQLCAVFGLLALTVLICRRDGKRLLAAGIVWVAVYALMGYLYVQGRYPARALLSVLLPAAAVWAMLLCASLAESRGWAMAAVCVPLLLCAAFTVYTSVPALLPNEELALEVGDPAAYLDEYAAWEEDTLFLYDYSLAGVETRMFPDMSEGIPQNVSYFGGWRMFTPGSEAQFERVGEDLWNRGADLLLNGDIVVASGVCDPMAPLLTEYLQTHVDEAIEPYIWGEDGGIYYLQFE